MIQNATDAGKQTQFNQYIESLVVIHGVREQPIEEETGCNNEITKNDLDFIKHVIKRTFLKQSLMNKK